MVVVEEALGTGKLIRALVLLVVEVAEELPCLTCNLICFLHTVLRLLPATSLHAEVSELRVLVMGQKHFVLRGFQ